MILYKAMIFSTVCDSQMYNNKLPLPNTTFLPYFINGIK